MTPTLWHIELSHYSEKARWALDHKGVRHRRKAPLPGTHGAYAAILTRGQQRRLPVLAGYGGRAVGDSTAIIAALEETDPDPSLYPEDPADRARALELEDFFDEELAPKVRAFVWHHIIDDSGATVDALMPGSQSPRARVMRTLLPVARPAIKLDYGVSAARAVQARAAILAAMDRLEAELQPSGYLVGDTFGVADLTGASLSTPLLTPPERPYAPRSMPPAVLELREELMGREAGRWVAEMYARHRGRSAEVVAEGGRTPA